MAGHGELGSRFFHHCRLSRSSHRSDTYGPSGSGLHMPRAFRVHSAIRPAGATEDTRRRTGPVQRHLPTGQRGRGHTKQGRGTNRNQASPKGARASLNSGSDVIYIIGFTHLRSVPVPPRRQPRTAMTPTPPEPPPAVVAAGALPAAAAAAACRQLPFYRFEAASSSPPPWFPPSPVTTSRAPTAMATQQGPPPGAGGDTSAAAAVPVAEVVVEVEDRMDLLWEDFNEELVARGGGKGSYRARAAGVGLQQARELWPESESSDAESSSEPAAARGCAPVLRPSSRSVGAVRRRAGTWVLLMRIFSRLFVIEKTAVSAASRQHAAGAMARAS